MTNTAPADATLMTSARRRRFARRDTGLREESDAMKPSLRYVERSAHYTTATHAVDQSACGTVSSSVNSDYRAKHRSQTLRRSHSNPACPVLASTLNRGNPRPGDSRMQVAIIGYGQTGRAHARTLQTLSGVSVSCVVDVDLGRAEEGARVLGASIWTDDVSAALRHPDLDAVIVATPHASHAALAHQALERGLHVFLEAPLALRLPDAQRVLAHARATATVVAPNFWRREAPGVRMIHGHIPRPTFIQIEAVIDPLHGSWMGTAEHGGMLGLVGNHALDLACFLMSSRPRDVHALGGRHVRRAAFADTVCAGIRFANGGVARVVVGEYGRALRDSEWRIWATDGAASATANRDLLGGASHTAGRSSQLGPQSGLDAIAPQEKSLRAFVNAVAGHGKPLATVEDGARAVQLADAVYEAMSTRRRIEVEEIPLHPAAGPVYADDSVADRRDHGFRA